MVERITKCGNYDYMYARGTGTLYMDEGKDN